MGATGGTGDLLNGLLIVPATLSPGAVSIKDGVRFGDHRVYGRRFVRHQSCAVLHPDPCSQHCWRVEGDDGTNVSALATGNFT
jgi:hypothetical protein